MRTLISFQLIALSVTLNGKKYSEFVPAERLLKVYEKVIKGEQLFSALVPEIFENLKLKIHQDFKQSKKTPQN